MLWGLAASWYPNHCTALQHTVPFPVRTQYTSLVRFYALTTTARPEIILNIPSDISDSFVNFEFIPSRNFYFHPLITGNTVRFSGMYLGLDEILGLKDNLLATLPFTCSK